MGTSKMVEDAFFNDSDPLRAQPFSKPTQSGWIHKGHETLVGDIAKILHRPGFFDPVDDFFIAELSKSSQDRNGDQGAQGVAVSAFIGVIERDETVDDGLPRNEATQEDEIVSGVFQMRLDPLSRKGIFKGMCYHGMNLFTGLRYVEITH